MAFDVQKILNYFNQKYRLVLLFVFFWIFFISDRDVFFLLKNEKIHRQLCREKEELEKKILAQEQELYLLLNNPDYLEQYARERFFFKKNEEIIFLQNL